MSSRTAVCQISAGRTAASSRRSISAASRPPTSTILRREACPATTATRPCPMSSAPASSSTSARFARPRSGGAATRARQPSPWRPTSSLRARARGDGDLEPAQPATSRLPARRTRRAPAPSRASARQTALKGVCRCVFTLVREGAGRNRRRRRSSARIASQELLVVLERPRPGARAATRGVRLDLRLGRRAAPAGPRGPPSAPATGIGDDDRRDRVVDALEPVWKQPARDRAPIVTEWRDVSIAARNGVA